MNEVRVAARLDATLGRLRAEADRRIASPVLRQDIDRLMTGVADSFANSGQYNTLSIHLPILMAGHLDGDVDDDRTGMAAACTSVYIGARLFDDISDGHPPSYLPDGLSEDLVMVWASLMMALPQAIVGDLGANATVRAAVSAEIGNALLAMMAGQADDLAGFDAVLDPSDVLRSVTGKAGAMVAMWAACGTWIGNADEAARARRFGTNLGIARQLNADVAELVTQPERDGVNVASTYPIAVHHAGLAPTERAAFTDRYRAATAGSEEHRDLLDDLDRSGSLQQTMLRAEMALAAALADLAQFRFEPAVGAELAELTEAGSFLPNLNPPNTEVTQT